MKSDKHTRTTGEELFPSVNQEYKSKAWYRMIWESINGPGSWDANPFVYVLEFSVSK